MMFIAPLFSVLVDELDTLRRMYGLITANGAVNILAFAVNSRHNLRIRGGDYGHIYP